ncbi:MAG: acyl-CoA dehydratase activase [Pseudomonadota bacterium]
MIVAGIDIGSRSIEVVLKENGRVVHTQRADTTYAPLSQCDKILSGLTFNRLVATGYGRKLLAQHRPAETITEIQAYSLGAKVLFPGCRAILDIGGQDTKAISLNPDGSILKFEMNDRCAAGTGKFLEFMAASLQMRVEDFGRFALTGKTGIDINSMCTVFAESEATSLMARGHKAEDIALALHQSVLKRSLTMLRRVGLRHPVVFAGGAARNPCLVRLINQTLAAEVLVPDAPDAVGALGAAVYGWRKFGDDRG